MNFTHFNAEGRACMVDVTNKNDTMREAAAEGLVRMRPDVLAQVIEGRIGKGDVLGVAQVAGIMAAKNVWQMIPMCHPLLLTGVNINFRLIVK